MFAFCLKFQVFMILNSMSLLVSGLNASGFKFLSVKFLLYVHILVQMFYFLFKVIVGWFLLDVCIVTVRLHTGLWIFINTNNANGDKRQDKKKTFVLNLHAAFTWCFLLPKSHGCVKKDSTFSETNSMGTIHAVTPVKILSISENFCANHVLICNTWWTEGIS